MKQQQFLEGSNLWRSVNDSCSEWIKSAFPPKIWHFLQLEPHYYSTGSLNYFKTPNQTSAVSLTAEVWPPETITHRSEVLQSPSAQRLNEASSPQPSPPWALNYSLSQPKTSLLPTTWLTFTAPECLCCWTMTRTASSSSPVHEAQEEAARLDFELTVWFVVDSEGAILRAAV